jgi:hypothetical protein
VFALQEDNIAAGRPRTGYSAAGIVRAVTEWQRLAASLAEVGVQAAPVPEMPLLLHTISQARPEVADHLIDEAGRRPVSEVFELAVGLCALGDKSRAMRLVQRTVQLRSPEDAADFIRRSTWTEAEGNYSDIVKSARHAAATRPVADIRALVSRLNHQSAVAVLRTVASDRTVADIALLIGELRRADNTNLARALLSAAVIREADFQALISVLGQLRDHATLLEILQMPGRWDRGTRRAAAGTLRKTSLYPRQWCPLLRQHAWYTLSTRSVQAWVIGGALTGIVIAVVGLDGAISSLPSWCRLAVPLVLAAIVYGGSIGVVYRYAHRSIGLLAGGAGALLTAAGIDNASTAWFNRSVIPILLVSVTLILLVSERDRMWSGLVRARAWLPGWRRARPMRPGKRGLRLRPWDGSSGQAEPTRELTGGKTPSTGT